jgi:hypothetical protein
VPFWLVGAVAKAIPTAAVTMVNDTIDHFIYAINRRFDYSPLFNRDYKSHFKIRST